MGTKELRAKKIEYYGRPMRALNLYISFLLPVFVVYGAINLVWRATVASAQFTSTTEFMVDFVLFLLSVSALISIYGVDKFAFFSNSLFLLLLSASQVIKTFFPQLIIGGTVSGYDFQSVSTTITQGISSLSGAMNTLFAGLSDGISTAAGGALQLMAGGSMAMAGGGMSGMADSAMMMGGDMAMSGMTGMEGAAQVAPSLITKIVGLFIKTGEDFTLFSRAVECGIFVFICLFFILYFIAHRKFFFSSLNAFRVNDEIA